MTTSQQAKSGLKTFILTFVGSLLVFGAFYYLVSDPSESVSIEGEGSGSETLGYTKTADPDTATADVQGISDGADVVQAQVAAAEEVESPFGLLAQQNVDVQPRVVLAGATESTQSSVPNTGITSVTVGLVLSLTLFAFFAYLIFLNPRKYALSKFEHDVTKERK